MGRPVGNPRKAAQFISQGNKGIDDWLKSMTDRFEAAVLSEQAMSEAVDVIADDAYERTPVETGDLRKSQQREVEKTPLYVEGEISYNKNGKAPYAGFVHEIADAYHPVGEYKFLEKAMRAKFNDAMTRYAQVVKIGSKLS